MTKTRLGALLIAIVVGIATGTGESLAKETRGKRPVPQARIRPEVAHLAPPHGPYRAALLAEVETGRVLFSSASDLRWPPASMVKMMVALVALDALRRGEVAADQPVHVSREASRLTGSRIFLRPGEVFAFEELLQAMLIASANDAAVALSEAVAGSTDAMIRRMNARAREFGMTNTEYHSVHGLPPGRGQRGDMTTAVDLLTLTRELLLRYSEVLEYSSRAVLTLRGGRTRVQNTNRLIGQVAGVDGLKTGYYRVAGFNLTATAARDGMRLVSVVLGCPTLRCRFTVSGDLLEWGFTNYSKVDLVRAGEPLAVDVQVAGGTSTTLRPVAAETSTYLVRKDQMHDLEVRFQLPATVSAPVVKDQPLGEIVIHDGEAIIDVIPAISPLDVGSSGATPPGRLVSY